MNHSLRWNIFRLLLLLIWGVFVVVMTTQSGRVPFIQLTMGIVGNTGFLATIGHMSLFAILTGVLYNVLAQHLTSTHALWLSMIFVLILGTGTEFSQMGVLDRDASSADLLANWLGVFMVGFLIASFHQMLKRKQPA